MPAGIPIRNAITIAIEAILRADLRDHSGIALLAGHHQSGIAGQQLLQRKNQHRDEEQRRDQLNEAPAEEIQHGAAPVPYAIILTSASARSRAPARPASACSPRAWWCARSAACDGRDRSAAL